MYIWNKVVKDRNCFCFWGSTFAAELKLVVVNCKKKQVLFFFTCGTAGTAWHKIDVQCLNYLSSMNMYIHTITFPLQIFSATKFFLINFWRRFIAPQISLHEFCSWNFTALTYIQTGSGLVLNEEGTEMIHSLLFLFLFLFLLTKRGVF